MDVTNYLNHYYQVGLISGLMCLMPLHRFASLDAWRKPALRREWVPAWVVYLLRFQVAVLYFYAGLAKINADWLIHGQPLGIWMQARTELPIIGPWLAKHWVAIFCSWFAFLYDTTIWFFLSLRRTRVLAYGTVVLFHVLTHVFFDIGMFPFIMIVTTTIFFSESWPRRFMGGLARLDPSPVTKLTRPAYGLMLAYCLMQVLVPLRHHLYGGNVLWHEQGMRFAHKVMVREKNGSVTYHVTQKATGRTWQVSPHHYLDWRQANEMSAQPDLIVQLAKHIAQHFQLNGHGEVTVQADAWVSLNGRPPHRMIDPSVDLNRVSDGVGFASWIESAPQTPPHSPGMWAQSR
jgi:hypothetical protein